MIKLKRVGALALAVVAPVTLGAAKCQDAPPPKHSTKKVKPAPNPDPAPSNKRFPGNVLLTFWLDQDAHRTVTAYNVGAGYKRHYCNNSCHWSTTAKPGQLVTATTDYYAVGQKGWLKIQVIQANNGRVLCEDDNGDTGRSGGVSCSGTVVI